MKKTDCNSNEINNLIKDILLKSDINLFYQEKIKKFLLFLLNKNISMNLISRKLALNEINDAKSSKFVSHFSNKSFWPFNSSCSIMKYFFSIF